MKLDFLCVENHLVCRHVGKVHVCYKTWCFIVTGIPVGLTVKEIMLNHKLVFNLILLTIYISCIIQHFNFSFIVSVK